MTRVSRRRFLGGSTVALGLPWLEALAPSARADVLAPRMRLLCWYVPNGIHMPAWTPAPIEDEAAPSSSLPPILAPLVPVRAHVDVITGLRNDPADLPTAGQHAAGTAGFLTARRALRSESSLSLGISIDQVYAQAVGHETFVDSLALGIDGGDGFGDCDNGFSCAYSRNVSWSGPSTPRAKIVDPRLAFDMLFGGFDPAATEAERVRRRQRRTSVLDAVKEQTAALRSELGRDDRELIDGYLASVRGVEARVAASPPSCPDGERPEAPLDFAEHVELMIDLMTLALRCDATRAITFMLGNSASERDYRFLGVPGTHHDLSHHTGDPEKIAHLVTIGAWEVARFAALLERLADTPEGDGSLLDHTLVLFSSELSDGNMHAHDDLPVLLAGGAATGRAVGRHVHATDRPLADLHIAILQRLGLAVDAFGDDGTSPLPDI